MAFIKEKIAPKIIPTKKIIVKEDVFAKIKREGREQREAVINKEKEKVLANKMEEERLEKIVLPYLDKLEKQLEEKNLKIFWTFPDRAGFKKIKIPDFDRIQELVKLDIPKYANRKICLIQLSFLQNDPITDIYRKHGILLIVSLSVFHMDKNCMLNGKNKSAGCTFNWTLKDFKLTKPTFKLIESIMHIVTDGKYQSIGFSGIPISVVLNDLKKKKINLDDDLTPLAGC